MTGVCFVCVSLRAGGTEKIVSTLANGLAGRHSIHVLLLSNHPSFFRLDRNVELHQFDGKRAGWQRFAYWLRLLAFVRSTIRRAKPDIVLSFGEKISPFVRIATLGLKPKLLVFNRGSPIRSLGGSQGVLNPLVYPLVDRVIVQTEESVRLLKKSRYRFCRFDVLPNPVALPGDTAPLLQRSKRIVNVGSIGRVKNQEFLIHAFAACDIGRDWELQFVGDGPHRPQLQALVKQHGLEHRVNFLGEREDVPDILADAQVFAFTSLSEGFPNALAEALAHGCACISFNCLTGPSELIQDDVNGFLVPVGEAALYQQQLERLLKDGALRTRLGDRARIDIRKFSSEQMLERFERLVADPGL